MEFKNGDIVRIDDIHDGFSLFSAWFEDLPELGDMFYEGDMPQPGAVGVVVHVGVHSLNPRAYGKLVAVRVDNQVFLMEDAALSHSNFPIRDTTPHDEIINAALVQMKTKTHADYQLSKACGMNSSMEFFNGQLEQINAAIEYIGCGDKNGQY